MLCGPSARVEDATLILHGEGDAGARHWSERAQQLIQGAPCDLDVAHWLPREKPEEFSRYVIGLGAGGLSVVNGLRLWGSLVAVCLLWGSVSGGAALPAGSVCFAGRSQAALAYEAQVAPGRCFAWGGGAAGGLCLVLGTAWTKGPAKLRMAVGLLAQQQPAGAGWPGANSQRPPTNALLERFPSNCSAGSRRTCGSPRAVGIWRAMTAIGCPGRQAVLISRS